jgi:hypothetical protein
VNSLKNVFCIFVVDFSELLSTTSGYNQMITTCREVGFSDCLSSSL